MLDHLDVLLTIRKQLVTATAASTGLVTLTSTGNGFTRGAGSFVEDGFRTGMEVVPSGFIDQTPAIIASVTLDTIVLESPRTSEPAILGKLSVGIPPIRAWENVNEADIQDGRWYIDEDYIPGPSSQVTTGVNGEIHHLPIYVIRLVGLTGKGAGALFNVSSAVLWNFLPRAAFPLSDGRPLRVRSDPAPDRGQIIPSEGRATIVITIPFWTRTINPI